MRSIKFPPYAIAPRPAFHHGGVGSCGRRTMPTIITITCPIIIAKDGEPLACWMALGDAADLV